MSMVSFAILAAFLMVAPVQRRAVPVDDLQPAFEALRAGKPGELAFDAALLKLPALLESGSSDFVRGAAFIAAEHQRVECAPAMIEALRRENARPAATSEKPTRSL